MQLVTDKSDIRIKHFAHIDVAITVMEMADIVKETDVTHYTHFLSQIFNIALYAADKFGNISQSMFFLNKCNLNAQFPFFPGRRVVVKYQECVWEARFLNVFKQ